MIILRYMTESIFFFFSSRRRHTRCSRDWSSDVCSSDLFQDAKFGLFIHWGVYSVLGDGEWVMETRPINRTDYAKLPNFFNPTKFDPAAWVALAKAAGMK